MSQLVNKSRSRIYLASAKWFTRTTVCASIWLYIFFLLPKHFHFKIHSLKCLKVIVAKVYPALKVIIIKSAEGCTEILINASVFNYIQVHFLFVSLVNFFLQILANQWPWLSMLLVCSKQQNSNVASCQLRWYHKGRILKCVSPLLITEST